MEHVNVAGFSVSIRRVSVLVVGAGAAGLNAAVHLAQLGVEDALIITESLLHSTSRNAGSDKQTYSRLALSGREGDSVIDMAHALRDSGCMHGDIALIEAACSSREFFHLVSLGVDFPHDEYGRYGGYQTDNDPRQRGTSTGPWTSRTMVVKLLAEARRLGVSVEEGKVVGRLLTILAETGPVCVGAIVCAMDDRPVVQSIEIILAEDVIWAGGGPGDLHAFSVYPEGQWSSIGIPLLAGASAQNMTEWQFGVASLNPKWNLSGSYHQVVPTYCSTSQDGIDREKFLERRWPSAQDRVAATFRKGYEWPFDARRLAEGGSSWVDLLVFEESQQGRRIWMDFTVDPLERAGSFDPSILPEDARRYLESCQALVPCPWQRLQRMNAPAMARFLEAGIDLRTQRVEVGLCAQHLNGGLTGDMWWESDLKHLFPVGEANGSHGVRRPGGAALNAGQVGGMRAAQRIAFRRQEREKAFEPSWILPQVSAFLEGVKQDMSGSSGPSCRDVADHARQIITRIAGPVRDLADLETGLRFMVRRWEQIQAGEIDFGSAPLLPRLRLEGQILVSWGVLESLKAYVGAEGGSRGGCVIKRDAPVGEDRWREENTGLRERIGAVRLDGNHMVSSWVDTRPVPSEEPWFETMWQRFRTGRTWEGSPI